MEPTYTNDFKVGDIVYYPRPDLPECYYTYIIPQQFNYAHLARHSHMLEHGLAFHTKEGAITKAKKLFTYGD
jgi:hypothetical protein